MLPWLASKFNLFKLLIALSIRIFFTVQHFIYKTSVNWHSFSKLNIMKNFISLKLYLLSSIVLLFTVTANSQLLKRFKNRTYNIKDRSALLRNNTLSTANSSNSFSIPSLKSVHCLGGSGDEGEFSGFTTQTNDGGFINCSYSTSNDGDVSGNHGGSDVWITKLNSSGNTQWRKSYGGSWDDFANRAIQTRDGGYIFIGYTTSNDGDVSGNHGQGDLWIVKLTSNGNISWQKCYGGTGDEYAYYGIIQTDDGGFAAIGSSASNDGDANNNHGSYDVLVLKLNRNGSLEWTKTYGGSQDDYGDLIVQNNDGTYTISADTYSNDGNIGTNHGDGTLDTWIARLNSKGNIIWGKNIGGTDDEFNGSLITTHDGNILVGDYAGSHDGDVKGNHGVMPDGGDMWLVKMNKTGNIIWTKTLGGGNGNSAIDFPDDEVALFISETNNGEFLVAGGATSSDGDLTVNRGGDDAWILKLNPTGNIIWQKSFGGSNEDAATAIFLNRNESFTVIGWTYSNDFDFKHSNQHGKGDLFIAIFSPGSYNNLADVATNVLPVEIKNIKQEKLTTLNIYPNPFSQSTTINFSIVKSANVSLQIFDISGRLIKTLANEEMEAGNHEIKWNVSDERGVQVSTGIYYLKLITGNYIETKHLSIIK